MNISFNRSHPHFRYLFFFSRKLTVFPQTLPAVPLYAPTLSLKPSVSLDTSKLSYMAYPFMPSQFSNSIRSLHCLDSVRMFIILLPAYKNHTNHNTFILIKYLISILMLRGVCYLIS